MRRKGQRAKKSIRRKLKGRRIAESLTATTCILIFVTAVYLVAVSISSHQSPINLDSTLPRKAAIIDQLSLTQPNPSLTRICTEILQAAGFSVDYHRGEDVTVDLYRNLPSKGYGLIIFRIHSAGGVEGDEPLYLFTSEPFVLGKYPDEHLADRIVCVGTSINEPPFYFGITPQFVRHSMQGRFQNAIILMMTCRALTYAEMAKAFLEKGATVYVGWTGLVEADQNDQATIILLRKLITERQTIKQAVAQAMKEVGRDPAYNSQLGWCPAEKGDYTVLPYD